MELSWKLWPLEGFQATGGGRSPTWALISSLRKLGGGDDCWADGMMSFPGKTKVVDPL